MSASSHGRAVDLGTATASTAPADRRARPRASRWGRPGSPRPNAGPTARCRRSRDGSARLARLPAGWFIWSNRSARKTGWSSTTRSAAKRDPRFGFVVEQPHLDARAPFGWIHRLLPRDNEHRDAVEHKRLSHRLTSLEASNAMPAARAGARPSHPAGGDGTPSAGARPPREHRTERPTDSPRRRARSPSGPQRGEARRDRRSRSRLPRLSRRRRIAVVMPNGGLATTRNGRRGSRRSAASTCTTVTDDPGKRSRRCCARRGWSSNAMTLAPAATSGTVSAPVPAPMSSTRSPGRMPAAATRRRAEPSAS